MPEEVKEISEEEKAKQLLAEALKKREEACANELNDVLKKHGFTMRFNTVPYLLETPKQ